MTELEKAQYKAARLYFMIVALTREDGDGIGPSVTVRDWAYDTLLDTVISARIYAKASEDHIKMTSPGGYSCTS